MPKLSLPDFSPDPDKAMAPQIYRFLRERIVDNTAAPGTVLSENELAAFFNVSRMPVREAFNRLKQEGLIEIRPQRGTYVKKISVPNLKGICFIRCSIECNALYEGLRMDNASFRKVVACLKDNLRQQQELEHSDRSYIEFLRLDDEFHSFICDFGGHGMSWDLIQSIKGNMDRIRYFTLEHLSSQEHLTEDHSQLLQAISAKDYFLASGLLRTHLYEITHTYTTVMKERREWFE